MCSCWFHAKLIIWANLQMRNISDHLHDRLRRHARENNCTISAAVLTAVERELARWEWRKRLAQRSPLPGGVGRLARASGLGIVVQSVRTG